VDCQIGSGAASFVEYKLAGIRQLIRLTTNTRKHLSATWHAGIS